MKRKDSKDSQNIVTYLLQQNKALKEQLEDAREMVKINKIEMDILTKDNQSSKYIDIICNYRTICENHQKKIELLEKTIEDISSEKLILQQLSLEATSELSAREELHRDRIVEMQKIIQELETKLSQLDKKQQSYNGLTGFVERNREIFNPTEQVLSFKKREDLFKDALALLQLEKSKIKQNQDSLVKINGILRHKVVTMQAKLAMPNKNLGQVLDESLKRLMMYFIETQKRLLTGQDSESEGQEDLQLIAPQLAIFFGQQAIRRQKDYNVPHIDLLKIRGTIITCNQIIQQQLNKRNSNLSSQQKIERLQIQLEYTRRQLTRNIVQLREETDRRKILQRICEQLETRNGMLTQSNQRLSDKINKYLQKIRESKEKKMKFIQIDEILNSPSKILIQRDSTKDFKSHNNIRETADLIARNLQNFDTLEEYKIHLELLAKDLTKNKKIQNLQHLKKKEDFGEANQKIRFKRSTSNPFLYFNERRQEIMEVHPNMENIRNTERLQQTEFFRFETIGSRQNLDYVNI